MISYNKYVFTRKEYGKYLLGGMVITTMLGCLFYRSIFAVLILLPFSLLYVNRQKEKKIQERKWKLNLQFRDGIMSISAALNAGYSIENSIKEALKDLGLLYGEEDLIIKELEYILGIIGTNRTAEEAFTDLAERTDIEDIHNFAEVFVTAKRTGGDLMKIIRATTKTIGDKIEIKREMHTMIAAKQYEVKLMNMIPLGIIIYMWIFSPGFLNPLYHNIGGVITMSVALIVYIGAYYMSERIIHIEI